jgi:hypothetical protein
MKIISPRAHGVLDYVVAAAFLAAPSALGLSGAAALLSWTLAGVHLGLTLLTAFPLGAIKLIPFKVHGWIEFVVGPTLIAVPWILGFAQDPTARVFYIAAGALIFVTWLATDYRAS